MALQNTLKQWNAQQKGLFKCVLPPLGAECTCNTNGWWLKNGRSDPSPFGYQFLCTVRCLLTEPGPPKVHGTALQIFPTWGVAHIPQRASRERNPHANIQPLGRNARQASFSQDDSNHHCTKGTFLRGIVSRQGYSILCKALNTQTVYISLTFARMSFLLCAIHVKSLTRFLGRGSRKGEVTIFFQIINKIKKPFQILLFSGFFASLHLLPI